MYDMVTDKMTDNTLNPGSPMEQILDAATKGFPIPALRDSGLSSGNRDAALGGTTACRIPWPGSG